MEKVYRLNGLDCANCAAKIERNIQQVKGVKAAQVDFMTTKLTIEADEDKMEQVCAEAEKIVHKIEPDVTLQINQVPHKYSVDRKKVGQILIALVAMLILTLVKPPMPWELLGYLIVYLWIGLDVVKTAVANIFQGEWFDENFLMAVATIGAFAIGQYPEAVAVMLFYQIGEFFQDYAVQRSKKSITALLAIRPDTANLLINDEVRSVAPETVKVGDVIVVAPGEKVPLDGVIMTGESFVDTSALTGESVPRNVKAGETILSGFINQSGRLTIKVAKAFGDSTVSKILDLVENASSKKAPAENFITTFAHYYTPIVVGLAAALAIIPPLVTGQPYYDWLYRALTFLVISCPCALVISVPLSFFGGIGGASKAGILIKGSNYIETLAKLKTVVFDKTGTLTKGVFTVQTIETTFDQAEFLHLLASLEQHSNHPIAQSILAAYGQQVAPVEQLKEEAGYGLQGIVAGHEVMAGNDKLLTKYAIPFEKAAAVGTIIYVVIDRKYAGHVVIADELKAHVKDTMTQLKQAGITRTIMLTGDNKTIASAIGDSIGIDEVHSELLPADKVEQLEAQLAADKKVAFVGDGMNDAPVLARADLGIAMGGLGSDAAIEAADVVIMDDQPEKIPAAIEIARKTMRIVKQNIVFAIGIKVLVLALGAIGFASMAAAVFADVGVTVLAVLNAMRCLKVK